jgi:endonuclease/exonuclease/phosphatase family metal-dependent hydrolase
LAYLAAGETRGNSLRVMSFNIDCRFCDLEHAHGESWNERVSWVKDTFARWNPDLIGIQEPVFEVDVKQLTPEGYSAIYNNNEDIPILHSYADATILYRTDRFKVLDWGSYWLSRRPDADFALSFDPLALPRLVIWSVLEDLTTGQSFYFGSTHFDHGDDYHHPDSNCVKSSYLVLDRSEEPAQQYPMLFTGDWNSHSQTNAYAILTNTSADFNFNDAHDISQKTFVETNLEEEPAYDYKDAIDHIFYANVPEVATYEVSQWAVDMWIYGENQQYASDHWAIMADITILEP